MATGFLITDILSFELEALHSIVALRRTRNIDSGSYSRECFGRDFRGQF